MIQHKPILLGYATPKPANCFARMPIGVIIQLAVVVPGLSSSLIRGSIWRCLLLSATVVIAFLIFGPLWGEVLFRSTRWTNFGLYPFLLTCGVVETMSVRLAIKDRRATLSEIVS